MQNKKTKTVILIFVLAAFWYGILWIAFDRSERTTCAKYLRWQTEYADFYYTEAERAMCQRYGMVK